MKKLTLYLMPLLTLLLGSSCSNFRAEKEIVTVEKIIKPTIALATKPNPVIMKNSDVIVITEDNLDEVIERVKAIQGGQFVVYGLDLKSFENAFFIALFIVDLSKGYNPFSFDSSI